MLRTACFRLLAGCALALSTAPPAVYAGSLVAISPQAASSHVSIFIIGTGFNTTAADNEVTFIPQTGAPVSVNGSAVVTLNATTGTRRLAVLVPGGLPTGRTALRVRNRATGEISEGVALELIAISLPETSSAPRGTSGIFVRIDGSPNVRFSAASTKAFFGAGVSVGALTVHSPTSLTVRISIAARATVGPRNVEIRGPQVAVAVNAFTVGGPNQPPVARPGQSYTGIAGQQVAFDGSASSDPDPGDSIVSYAWLFGDGTSGTGATPTHAYSSAGTFTASLTVRDGHQAEHTATVPVTIAPANRAPVANPGGPYSGTAGQSIAFDGSASSDPDAGDSIASYAWLFGDGASGTGETPSHIYSSAGTFTASLTVRDGHNAEHTATALVTIAPANTAPVSNPGGPYSGTAGQSIVFDGSQSGDADSDQLTFEWAFGDGAVGTGATVEHTYATAGTFVGALTVSDGRGGSGTGTFTVNVTPASLGRGVITGRIYDDATGLPIENAVVRLVNPDGSPSDSLSVTSDALGRYRVSVPPGQARVRITKDGSTPADLRADVDRRPANGSGRCTADSAECGGWRRIGGGGRRGGQCRRRASRRAPGGARPGSADARDRCHDAGPGPPVCRSAGRLSRSSTSVVGRHSDRRRR